MTPQQIKKFLLRGDVPEDYPELAEALDELAVELAKETGLRISRKDVVRFLKHLSYGGCRGRKRYRRMHPRARSRLGFEDLGPDDLPPE